MIIDASLPPLGLKDVAAAATAAETMGFDALWSAETMRDPFLPGPLIATHTSRLKFGTAVAIAFARSPAVMAYTAWDLAQVSKGRFILGLGTQVKAHIERRYGMPWPESPVKKLREQVTAIRAFWDCWQNGTPLNLQGEYYKLSLMSPFFNPGPIRYSQIPIFIAGVNTGLARLAGEMMDGFLVHPFHTPRYLKEIILPAIEEGAVKSGRQRKDIQVSAAAFVAGDDVERFFVRSQIAFYASTPSYRKVMELHGWQEIAERLTRLAARGEWSEMPELIDDEMLAEFSVLSDPEEIRPALLARYEGAVDRLGVYLPFVPGERDKFWSALLNQR